MNMMGRKRTVFTLHAMELFSMWPSVVIIPWITLADYAAGGSYEKFAGKDVTIACAKGFVSDSNDCNINNLSAAEKQNLETYASQTKKVYPVVGTLKEKQS